MMDKREPSPRVLVQFEVHMPGGDPERLTELFGVEPDEKWRVGDPIPNWPIPKGRAFSCWRLEESTSSGYDAGELLTRLLCRIPEIRQKTAGLPIDAAVMIYVFLTPVPGASTPGLSLGEETVRLLADLKAALDLSIRLD